MGSEGRNVFFGEAGPDDDLGSIIAGSCDAEDGLIPVTI